MNPQQHATVKIETFPYTKYGTLNGTVLTVSNDAVSDEKKGLIYHARVLLDRTKINVDGKRVNLQPVGEFHALGARIGNMPIGIEQVIVLGISRASLRVSAALILSEISCS